MKLFSPLCPPNLAWRELFELRQVRAHLVGELKLRMAGEKIGL